MKCLAHGSACGPPLSSTGRLHLFTLTATVVYEVNRGSLSYVSFWDETQSYGLSLACYVEDADDKLEVLVEDQTTCYPDSLNAELTRNSLRVCMPPGTRAHWSVHNEYVVNFSIDDPTYQALAEALAYLLAGRAQLVCKPCAAGGAA